MNAKSIAAIVLIVSGVVVFVFSGITFTTPGRNIEFLGVRIETRETHFVSPMVGALALGGGIALLLLKSRTA